MTLSEVCDILKADIHACPDRFGIDVKTAFGADLMSDVLAFSRAGALLLTGIVNVQTVQTAFIAEINGIILVRGKKPDERVMEIAHERRIPLLGTPYSMYEACGILYRAGIPSTMQCEQQPAPAKST
jgi:predicted transcriptional regulator